MISNEFISLYEGNFPVKSHGICGQPFFFRGFFDYLNGNMMRRITVISMEKCDSFALCLNKYMVFDA